MKLFISLSLVCVWAHASMVVIYDSSGADNSKGLSLRLTEKHGIPQQLIRTFTVKKCPDNKMSGNKLVLCANKKELEVLNSNSSIIKSLAVFKSEVE